MKLFFLWLLLAVMPAMPLYAQVNGQPPVRFYLEKYDLYGYRDARTGDTLIPAIYSKAEPFHDGWALVQTESKSRSFFINSRGTALALPDSIYVYSSFSNGLALVKAGKKYAFITPAGKLTLTQSIESLTIYGFSEGLARRGFNYNYDFIDNTGRSVCGPYYNANDFHEGLAAVKTSNGWGFIDTKGNMVIRDSFYVDFINSFNHAVVKIRKPNGNHYLVNKKGEKVSDEYLSIDEFTNGLAVVKNWNQQYGLIDTMGKEIVKPKYPSIYLYKDSTIIIKKDGKSGLLDFSGKEVCPIQYNSFTRYRDVPPTDSYSSPLWNQFYSDNKSPFYNNMAIVNSGGKLGLIHKNGHLLTEIKYDHIFNLYDSLFAVNTGGKKDKNEEIIGGKWGFLYKDGKPMTDLKFDGLFAFREGVARVLTGQLYGVIDQSGKEIIPPTYPFIGEFSEGLAVVNTGGVFKEGDLTGGKWGYINKKGQVQVPIEYDNVTPFHDGLAAIIKNNQLYYINQQGKQALQITYENISPFAGGFARVTSSNKKAGFIDRTGKEIIPCKYDNAGSFSEGLVIVVLNNQFGYCDQTGKEIIPLTYLNAGPFENGLAVVETSTHYLVINKKGETLKKLNK